MSKKYLTYTYRVYPNKNQRELLYITFESCREVYNIFLKDMLGIYRKFKKYINYCVLNKKEANEKLFFKRNKLRKASQVRHLHENYMKVDSLALVAEQNNVINGFKRYFDGINAFPKYKKRNDKNTYVTSNVNNNIRVEFKKIRIPKVGMVKAKIHRDIPKNASIKKAVIKEDKCGKFYIGLVLEIEDTDNDNTEKIKEIVGLDFKVGDVFVTDKGYIPRYGLPYRESLNTLKNVNRKITNKIKFSNKYKKTIQKIRKLHIRIVNKRKDLLHKLSNELAKKYKYIVVETLSIIDIAKKLRNGINTYDTSYNRFINMIKYKAIESLVFVDRWFPSSKTCSRCGNKKRKLKLSQRIYRCNMCGLEIDRDINAAINIKNEGERILKKS